MTVREQAKYLFSGQKVRVFRDYCEILRCNANQLYTCPYADEEIKCINVGPGPNILSIELIPTWKKEKIITISDVAKLFYSDTHVKIVDCSEPLFCGRAKELSTCEYKDKAIKQLYISAMYTNTIHIEIGRIEAP